MAAMITQNHVKDFYVVYGPSPKTDTDSNLRPSTLRQQCSSIFPFEKFLQNTHIKFEVVSCKDSVMH